MHAFRNIYIYVHKILLLFGYQTFEGKTYLAAAKKNVFFSHTAPTGF